LAPKDLGVLRERSRAFRAKAKSRVQHASEKEEKAKSSVNSGRFGLFVDLLGRIPTGSTISAPRFPVN